MKYLHDLPHIREGLDHLLTHDKVFKKSGLTLDDFPWPYMRPGFAGIENELLFEPTTTLLFGDAKDTMSKLLAEVKAL